MQIHISWLQDSHLNTFADNSKQCQWCPITNILFTDLAVEALWLFQVLHNSQTSENAEWACFIKYGDMLIQVCECWTFVTPSNSLSEFLLGSLALKWILEASGIDQLSEDPNDLHLIHLKSSQPQLIFEKSWHIRPHQDSRTGHFLCYILCWVSYGWVNINLQKARLLGSGMAYRNKTKQIKEGSGTELLTARIKGSCLPLSGL